MIGPNGIEFVQSYTAPINRVVLFGGAGNDVIDASALNVTAEIYGGTGDDTITGGSAADILVGGDGNDVLAGNGGRDLLIGGRGADRVDGDADEDIVVGGYTLHDADVVALRAISTEWTSSRLYAERVSNIRGPVTTGLNAGSFLRADVTTFDDNAVDTLFGDAGRDWFFFNVDRSTARDKFLDAAGNEVQDEVDLQP
jgi:Ca2+-binding RTX toxin-like protein